MKNFISLMAPGGKSSTISDRMTQPSSSQTSFMEKSINNPQNRDNFLTQFQGVADILEKIAAGINKQPQNYEIEPRDRQIVYELPSAKQGQRLDKDLLERWVTNLCKEVFSAGFFYFERNTMSFEQVKIFCSENIIQNIVRLNKNYRLEPEDIKTIDEHIEDGVTAYLLTKYPIMEIQTLNNALQAEVNETDNFDALENDLFFDAVDSYGFELRESGNYNDLIMTVLNDLIKKADQKLPHQTETLYQKFYDFMHHTFELAEQRQWTESGHSSQAKSLLSQKQADQYRIRVKSYTSWAIGRKISKNITQYSAIEIVSKHLVIKSPAILRILTKWCEELCEKFDKKNYFLDRADNLKCQKGENVNTSFAWLKASLNDAIEQERTELQKYLAQIFVNNYDQQAVHLFRALRSSHFTHVEAIQKAAGVFTCNIANNLHSYILLYLNRLIHGLLKVARRVYDRDLVGRARWASPPNLISYRIGDLMRCKIESKDKEILQLYRHLNRLSKNQPHQLKIIRIKNRLREGTSDILLNVRFKKLLICEIQLAVNSDHSNFMKCSSKYNHFIYEVKRSIFGPLTELCSIWRCLDGRFKVYQKIAQSKKEFSIIQTTPTPCEAKGRSHKLNKFNQPFVCFTCQQSYSHSNYIWPHQRCESCKIFTQCCRCRLHHMPEEEEKALLFHSRPEMKQLVSKLGESEDLPRYGVCFQVESKDIILQKFVRLTLKGKTALYTRNGQKIEMICEASTPKQVESFKEKYILFRFPYDEGRKLVKINEVEVNNQYLMPKFVNSIYREEKEFISLTNEEITDSTIKKVLHGSDSERQSIKTLQLPDNKLSQVDYIAENFPNLNKLVLNRNNIVDVTPLTNLRHLEELNLRDNMIEKLPIQLFSLGSLTNLTLRNNNIRIIPEQIGRMTSLEKLDLNQLSLRQLPQSLSLLANLRQIDLSKNKLGRVPYQLRNLQNLGHLALSSNHIHTLPDWIGELKQLRVLQLNKNGLQSLPESFLRLERLQELQLNHNSFKQLNFKCPLSLKIITINHNQITTIQQPFFANSQNLSRLEMSNNQIVSLPMAVNLWKNMRNFDLSHNKLTSLASIFGIFLLNLQKIDLSHNQLKQFPKELCDCFELSDLQLAGNPIQGLIPQKLFENCLKLQNLDLSSTKLSHLPVKLVLIAGLKRLNLSETSISEKSLEVLKGLKLIEELILCKMKLKAVPAAIKDLAFLQVLNMRQNQIQSLDEELFTKLTHLRTINFENNRLAKVPDSIRRCRLLKVVNFSHNKIKEFPYAVCSCPRLQRMEFNDNEMDKIETDVSMPTSVVDVNMRGNRIHSISDAFFRNADSLVHIDLSRNVLLTIPRILRICTKLMAPQFDKIPMEVKADDIACEIAAILIPSEGERLKVTIEIANKAT